MELARTGKTIIQIQYYQGTGITKISQHLTAENAEEELRIFKKGIKKENLKEIMKNIKVFQIEELAIIKLGKNL